LCLRRFDGHGLAAIRADGLLVDRAAAAGVAEDHGGTIGSGPAIASVAEGNKRSSLFDAHAAAMPNYARYQRVTTRIIPVVILARIS
jgi:hypothetical protein